jgi:hypothetical protein
MKKMVTILVPKGDIDQNHIKIPPHKTKNRSAIRPAILLLGICLKECNSVYNKFTCTPIFIAALFTIAKLWK